jgi:hypothetical protein
MKSRLCLIFALVALMGAALAGAATAEPAGPMSTLSGSADPTAASFLCGLSQKATTPELSGSTPAPLLKAGFVCGACSLNGCAGHTGGTFGASCQISITRRGTCQNVYGDVCTEDNLLKCQCWNGPLP